MDEEYILLCSVEDMCHTGGEAHEGKSIMTE